MAAGVSTDAGILIASGAHGRSYTSKERKAGRASSSNLILKLFFGEVKMCLELPQTSINHAQFYS